MTVIKADSIGLFEPNQNNRQNNSQTPEYDLNSFNYLLKIYYRR